jgi:ribosome maturation factor RimP
MEMAERIKGLIASYLEEKEIDVVDIIYRREGGDMVLRLLVDKPDGITIGECEELNNTLSDLLDKEDLIKERYLLEVSSPGLDRPLKTESDFKRVLGKALAISTYESVDGKKDHGGILVGMDSGNIVLERGGISTVIPKAKIARAVQKIEL